MGSSPHTRGARSDVQPSRPATGIIPAYAGSTRRVRGADRSWRDHPRIRGEHARPERARRHWRGSSPHTRGALVAEIGDAADRRIIPAYAGSTRAELYEVSVVADHPRIRGEHSDRGYPGCGGCGSSPHTRGARAAHLRADRCVSDHPRIRGEHHREGSGINMDLGSSPHTRGAPVGAGRALAPGGIIPAYAGSTGGVSLRVAFLSDHPRIRGEHISDSDSPRDNSGSSPHTRGALAEGGGFGIDGGIIPAYAGSTRRAAPGPSAPTDHPRIRGEHSHAIKPAFSRRGSSPHTRGARRRP